MTKEYTSDEIAEIADKYHEQADIMEKQGDARAVRILRKVGRQLDNAAGKGIIRKSPPIVGPQPPAIGDVDKIFRP